MRRPRAMRFHAALRAAHNSGGFGHVQLLPVTHDKSLALTSRQPRELLLNNFKHLSSLQLLRRRFLRIGPVGGLQGFKLILFIVFSARRSMASWTMSSAASSSRTANTACLNARRSTLSRNADSSLRDAKVGPLSGRLFGRRWYQKRPRPSARPA